MKEHERVREIGQRLSESDELKGHTPAGNAYQSDQATTHCRECGGPFNHRDRQRAMQKMDEALKAVRKWRDGPEGPEVLFSDGAAMIKKVNAALSAAKPFLLS